MTDGDSLDDAVDILLVEDNPGDVRLTEEAFEDGQVPNTLHVATDGVEALDFLHRRDECVDAPRPDVVLLDLDLPRMDGEDVLDEIREDPDLQEIPVVVLTGSEAQEDVVKSHELDANAYLTKPVDPEEFAAVVRSLGQFWLSDAQLPPAEED